ncbi:MAG TPA: S8 family peptidase [Ramlibacter sp.]|nr:S8 family peptidase [Ramlibacter sp.]
MSARHAGVRPFATAALPRIFTALLALVFWGGIMAPAAAAPPGQDRTRYIVVFKAAATDVAQHAQGLANGAGSQPDHVYTHVLKGFSVTLPNQSASAFLSAMQRHPLVDYIEQDEPVRLETTELTNSWNLDRIDTRGATDGYYTYDTTGAGVRIYVVDTGLRSTHTQFTGRVLPGKDLVGDGRGTEDCHGHGTMVSSVAAGTKFGVAKGALLVPVRVFGCTGVGASSTTIAGLDWIAANAVRPAVVNMSLSNGGNRSTDAAVASLAAQGIVTAAAAGNQGSDACLRSPAREPTALTVGSIQWGDAQASDSNSGTCLDLYAPGVNIWAAYYLSDWDYTIVSGTSLATPHATGAVAQLLETNPTMSAANVISNIRSRATPGTVTLAGPDSPLLVLYNGADAYPTQTTVRIANLAATKKLAKNNWTVTVQLSVRDLYGAAISGATITTRFSTSTSDSSCVTTSAGTCSVIGTMQNTSTSTTFTVNNVTATGKTYTGAENFATSTTVNK